MINMTDDAIRMQGGQDGELDENGMNIIDADSMSK